MGDLSKPFRAEVTSGCVGIAAALAAGAAAAKARVAEESWLATERRIDAKVALVQTKRERNEALARKLAVTIALADTKARQSR